MTSVASTTASSDSMESPLCSMLAERPTFNSLLNSTKFPDFEDFAVKFSLSGNAVKAYLKLSGGELRVFLEPVCSVGGEIPSATPHAVFPLQLLSGIVLDASTLSLAFAPHTDAIFGFRTGHTREAVLLKEAIPVARPCCLESS